MVTSHRAIFLDRDGVLNEPIVRDGVPHPPGTLDDLVVAPETEAGCRALRRAGWLLIMVTNQPDLARGAASRETVDSINHEVRRRLALHDVFVCPHDDVDRCGCRKPKPGLLLAAAACWGVELSDSVMVGDRWRDVEAGRRAGCATVLVWRQYDERREMAADRVVRTLDEAAAWILHPTSPAPKEV